MLRCFRGLDLVPTEIGRQQGRLWGQIRSFQLRHPSFWKGWFDEGVLLKQALEKAKQPALEQAAQDPSRLSPGRFGARVRSLAENRGKGSIQAPQLLLGLYPALSEKTTCVMWPRP